MTEGMGTNLLVYTRFCNGFGDGFLQTGHMEMMANPLVFVAVRVNRFVLGRKGKEVIA